MTTLNKEIVIYQGDGAFRFVEEAIITPLLTRVGGDTLTLRSFDWSACNRVATDGAIVTQSIEYAKSTNAAVIKYPGATPDAAELDYLKMLTGCEPVTPLGKGNSPNAALRGASGFDGSIIRTPAESASLIEPIETQWNKNTAVTINALKSGGRKSNQQVILTQKDQRIEVVFCDSEGKEYRLQSAGGDVLSLSKGSPISLSHVDKQAVETLVRESFEEALLQKADVTLAVKGTVLKSTDALITKIADSIFNTEYKTRFEQNGAWYGSKLVDDAFAWLIAEGSSHKNPQIMLTPDDAYGAQMQKVLEEIKAKGMHYDHTQHPVAVARFSNGIGDEYGAFHFPATDKTLVKAVQEQGGSLLIRDADSREVLYSQRVGKDENMWIVATHNLASARIYANRMIDWVLNDANRLSGKKVEHLVFGFDPGAANEAPIAQAIADIITQRQGELQARNIHVSLQTPQKAAADSLTMPNSGGTLLALNNLWGDIIADLYPALANNRASYDSALICDSGFVVETGSGGTAPDLLYGREGKGGLIRNQPLNLNPVAILSGYSQAVRYSGEAAFADALDGAIDTTLKQGYLTRDLITAQGRAKIKPEHCLQDALSLAKPRAVDTRVFMAAFEVNILNALGKPSEEAKARLMTIRDQVNIPLSHSEGILLEKCATRPGDCADEVCMLPSRTAS